MAQPLCRADRGQAWAEGSDALDLRARGGGDAYSRERMREAMALLLDAAAKGGEIRSDVIRRMC